MTVRHLESLVRIAQAHARIELRDYVTESAESGHSYFPVRRYSSATFTVLVAPFRLYRCSLGCVGIL